MPFLREKNAERAAVAVLFIEENPVKPGYG